MHTTSETSPSPETRTFSFGATPQEGITNVSGMDTSGPEAVAVEGMKVVAEVASSEVEAAPVAAPTFDPTSLG